jgi:hypothetical protein
MIANIVAMAENAMADVMTTDGVMTDDGTTASNGAGRLQAYCHAVLQLSVLAPC